MPRKTYDDVIATREQLICQAKLDTRKWCVSPMSMVEGCHSDQYWMERLSPQQPTELDANLAHQFLVSFRLTNRVVWNNEEVAVAISDLVTVGLRDDVKAVVSLAKILRSCNRRGTRQTSAASKLSMFAFPASQLFIWDRLAARSARARDWHRDGRRRSKPLTAVFRDADGEHDYPAHHASCARALVDELAQDDFQAAVAGIEQFLRKIDGPMADRALVPSHFVERRLLDKLMF